MDEVTYRSKNPSMNAKIIVSGIVCAEGICEEFTFLCSNCIRLKINGITYVTKMLNVLLWQK